MRGLSFRAKVFILFAGAALLIVAPALLLIAQAVERNVRERAVTDLTRAAESLLYTWTLREQTLVSAARVRAFDPDVADAWRDGSRRELARVLRADLDKDLTVAAADTAFRPLVGPPVDSLVLRQAAAAPGVATVVLPDSGEPVRIAVQPVVARDSIRIGEGGQILRDTTRLGTVAVLGRLAPTAIRKDAAIDAVALLVGDSLLGTTFSGGLGEGYLASPDRAELERSAGRGLVVDVGAQSFLAVRVPLPARGVPVSALLFSPITEELRIAEGIRRSLFGIGFAALLLALLLAAVVARIVARPAQALAAASTRLAEGDYLAPLPRAGGDEIGQLARAFGDMRAAIAERESRLRSAQAEMIHREKLAAMGRLVAQLSHEINNPIYNIQNCLEALERRGDPGDPNREFLTLAQEELRRMAALTRQLLDQSRPLSDAARPLDLNTLVERVLTLARSELASRGVAVETELAGGLPTVVAHPEGIQQVLANLVSNAADAMPAGGRLRVQTRSADDAVEVVVEDTGTGIEEADLPHIFEAFYTTKPGVTGLGLGLFVSEGIIRGHRGRLTVESTPGQGSRFVIRLPRQTLDPAPARAEPATAAA